MCVGRQPRELGRELDRARMRVRPVGVEGQLAHLRERGLADLLAVRVADVDREEPGERVEIPLAVVVPEVTALAAHDHGRLVAVHAREVQPEVVARAARRSVTADCSSMREHTQYSAIHSEDRLRDSATAIRSAATTPPTSTSAAQPRASRQPRDEERCTEHGRDRREGEQPGADDEPPDLGRRPRATRCRAPARGAGAASNHVQMTKSVAKSATSRRMLTSECHQSTPIPSPTKKSPNDGQHHADARLHQVLGDARQRRAQRDAERRSPRAAPRPRRPTAPAR